ncbi:MAG: deoxyguanosinetriphosphate triphosphohydrolase [Actinobacteria bacterium QS_5_72_10]|nr:MAG: deoxyguanosinetriphosphate triphosphohydrolase [Actinobacteria bacterium QS_5_72_10]
MTPQFVARPRAARLAEEAALSPAAARSATAYGRDVAEPDDAYRTPFERDRDRILHSKAFRRLKHKTQVFLNPEGDHFVTRLTHALQVTQVARSLAGALALNEALAEAIALGHDCGHTPFGHTGEEALSPYVAGGWHHAAQGVRIYEVLEPANLTWEARDGIRAHTWSVEPPPATAEGWCVRYADRIAYLTHDALDALRAEVIDEGDLPAAAVSTLGRPGTEWIDTMIRAVIEHTLDADELGMQPSVARVMHELREFMFERVYRAGENRRRHQAAVTVIRQLMDHHLAHPDQLPPRFRDGGDVATRCADYVAGMTDRFALACHDRLFRPVLVEPPYVPGDPA